VYTPPAELIWITVAVEYDEKGGQFLDVGQRGGRGGGGEY
jgi:hypothetical protein